MKNKFFIILFSILTFCACREDIPQIPDDAVLFLPFSTTSIIADGDSCLKIQLKTNYPNSIKQATLITSHGVFINGIDSIKVEFDIKGIAVAYLKSSTIGQAIVTAKIYMTTSYLSINSNLITFSTSYPDRILISCNSTMSNTLGEKLVLTTTLRKSKGTVSQGLDLNYKAFDINGNSKGVFFNGGLSDSSGTSSVDFYLQDSNYTGIIFFKATCLKDTAVYGKTQIYVKVH